MAKSVNEAFNEFNSDIVNLLKDKTDKARSSRDWLYGQLNSLDSKEDLNFPFKYEEKHINYGSFQRRTKIRELDDIDLMFCLTADGATYYKSSYSNEYKIYTTNAGTRLKKLSDENVLNSRRVVNKLKTSLSTIDQYKSAELHSRGEAATLSLVSYEWVYDIVPCFYTDTELYLIPDGNGNWKPTDPRIDQKRVTDTNKTYKGKALQLIRILKYWNRHNSSYTIPSYLFENFVINYINSKDKLYDYIDFDITNFFDYLSDKVFSSLNDPKGLEGNLNKLSYEEQKSISEKSQWAYQKAVEAVKAETDDKDHQKSINIWREIYGRKFPRYE